MYKIAVIPGDGIGPEVIAEGVKVLDLMDRKYQINLNLDYFNLGAERYLEKGEILPDSVLKELEAYDAIYLGAVGDPRVKSGILEKGILLTLRFYFDQYVNLRPVKLIDEKFSPLKNKGKEDINFTVIRENTEGIYAGAGGFLRKDTPHEIATQEMISTRMGVDRIIEFAFNYARENGRVPKLTLCDKSNVLTYAHDLWQRSFKQIAEENPDINTDHYLIDAITMKMVRTPEIFDVIVTCNIFGDIITDLGAELQGGMGLAVSGNINPDSVSMFEPVHGSAPDIAGKKEANPLAAILAAGMLLENLGYGEANTYIEEVVSEAVAEDQVTSDLGGELKTNQVGDYIVGQLDKIVNTN